MPRRAPTACRRPGCGGLVVGGICSRCGVLKRARDMDVDRQRGGARMRGYDARWERVRMMHLRAEPLCRRCASLGYTTPAMLVDHILPIADGGAVLDEDNLQSLCIRCHGIKTAEDLRKRRGREGASQSLAP